MPSRLFSVFFVLLWFVPPLFTFLQLDSYTISTVGIVFIFNLVYFLLEKKVAITKVFFSILVLSTSFLLIHSFLAAMFFFKGYNLNRNLTSIFLIFVLLLGAYNFKDLIQKVPEEILNKLITRIFYFYLFLIILSLFTKVFPSRYEKPIFPYPEPSHLALFFGPIIAYMIISSKTKMKRLLLIFVGLIISLVIKNMTLLVTMVIISVFVYSVYVLPILIISSIGIYYFSDLQYFSERLDFGNMRRTNNLSSLVYIKGFQLIEEGLKVTNGWGIGFQQLGHVPLRTEVGDYLKSRMNGMELNSQDGGFTAAKIIAEFGVFGLLTIILFVFYLLKQWFKFRKISLERISSQEALFFASLITIFSELFFRGLGYFSASIFLFITMLLMRSKST